MISHMNATITADATLLDVVSKWPATEEVFRHYDDVAGKNHANKYKNVL